MQNYELFSQALTTFLEIDAINITKILYTLVANTNKYNTHATISVVTIKKKRLLTKRKIKWKTENKAAVSDAAKMLLPATPLCLCL